MLDARADVPVADIDATNRRLQGIVCAAGLAAGVVLSYISIGLTPSLLAHHDLLLETLSQGTSAIVTGGALARVGHEPLLLVALAPMSVIPMYALFYWWAGQLWGDQLLGHYAKGSPRRARWIRRSEAGVRRWGVWALIAAPFLPIPTFVVEVLCGAVGMPLWLYLVGATIGMLLWEGLLIGLGWAIGHPAVHAVTVISHYSLWITIGLVAVVIAVAVVRRGRAGTVVSRGSAG